MATELAKCEKIESVTKDGKTTFKAKLGDHTYAIFKKGWEDLLTKNPGGTFSFDWEMTSDGKWRSITRLELSTEQVPAHKNGNGFNKEWEREKNTYIVRESALARAVDLNCARIKAGKVELATVSILGEAERFFNYIMRGPAAEEPNEPPVAKKDVVADEFADAAREAGYNLNDPDEKGLLHAWIKDQTGGKEWIKCNAGEKRKLITAMQKKADAKKQ